VVAPGFSEAALAILRGKQGLELLDVPPTPTDGMRDYGIANLDFKRVGGGLLVEAIDALDIDRGQLQVVTRRHPTLGELTDLLFAWRAVRHVRSNAIVLARDLGTIGVGAGQMSRVDAVRLAVAKAREEQPEKLAGAVMASDAFFPFADGAEAAIEAGVKAIIQPGGSKRDAEVIEACDRAGIAMVFTGRRHFRH
jgi:phosphoribosylaminoimidazolecarboxamide formyltransferase/IMP cyclohydrolase